MQNIDYSAFNKGLFVKENHSEKWEKAEFDVFEVFLSDAETLLSISKDQLPQFAFNVLEGERGISIHYPTNFLVTEIDLPKGINECVAQDEDLAKHWSRQFKTWYRKIKKSNNPYWMMYLTSSGHGFRFVIQTDKPINSENEYEEACLQFLQGLEVYGINYEFHDNSTINKGWYFPTYKRYFDVRESLFHPNLEAVIPGPTPTKTKKNVAKCNSSLEDVEKLISQIENLNIDVIEKDQVANAFLGDSKILMAKNYAAIKTINIDFVKENADTLYFYFTNCFVRVTKSDISTLTYDKLKGYIWESQIIPMEFRVASPKVVKQKSEFYSFIQDVSSDMQHQNDRKRFLSLRTTIGYLLHTYKDPAVPKSIVFMDASLKKDTNGRTGKGIVKNGLSKMRKLATEDGKRFNFRSQFSFSQVSLDTDILFIDDVTNRFDFEKLFSVLAEGVVVEGKYKDKFHLSFEDSPKILLTTYYAIQGSGDSFEGRIYEYEFSDYYRYGHSPKDKFGHLLFDQWDHQQWNLFYNFMVGCAKSYLRFGLKESQFINLKKVIAKTGFAFVEYLRDNIEVNKKYEKQKVFDDFIAENPSYRDWGRNSFTINMKEYYKHQRKGVKETHSGTTHYFMVIPTNSDLS